MKSNEVRDLLFAHSSEKQIPRALTLGARNDNP